MLYTVYILECQDGTLYTGITTDLVRRFAEHVAGKGKGSNYTRAKKVLRIVYQEKCADRSAASKREAAIKKMSRAEKLGLISVGGY